MASSSLFPPTPMSWGGSLMCKSPPQLFSSSIMLRSSIRKPSANSIMAMAMAPWLMLPPTFEDEYIVYNFYNLAKKKVIELSRGKAEELGETEVVGSSHGYLALFHKRKHRLFLYNPISRRRIGLPSVHTLSLDGPLDMHVTKVVVSDDQSRAMMIFGRADRLAFCCPRHSTKWTPLDSSCNEGRPYRVIVYNKRNKVFNCYTDYSVDEWDLRLTRPGKQLNFPYHLCFKSQPSWSHDIPNTNRVCYVVSAKGKHSKQLYIVKRYIMDREAYKTIGFSVYKLTRVGHKTLQVNYMDESLGNLIMFIGRNHSFALRAQDYPKLKPDSIYFTNDPRHTPLDWQTYGAHDDTGIYCYRNKTFLPLGYPCDSVSGIKGIVSPPIWFTPSV